MASSSGDKGKGKATDEDVPMLDPTELQIAVLQEFIKDEYPVLRIPDLDEFNYVVHEAVQRTLKAKHWNNDYEDIVETAILSTSIIEVPIKIMLPPTGGTAQTPGLIPQIPDGLKAICGRLDHLQFSINVPARQFRKGQRADVAYFLGTASIMPGLARIMPELKSFTLKIIINTGLGLAKDARAGFWKDLMCIDPSTAPPNDQLNKTVETVIDEVLAAVKTSFPSKVTKVFKLVTRYNPAEYRAGGHTINKSWQFNCKEVNLDWIGDKYSPFTTAWYIKKEEPLTEVAPS